jgi:hypothetical protein
MLAAVSVVMRYRSAEADSLTRTLYYARAMALPVVFIAYLSDSKVTDIAALMIFIAGMVADRLLFYFDFRPTNIKDTITELFQSEYEKERDKQRQDTVYRDSGFELPLLPPPRALLQQRPAMSASRTCTYIHGTVTLRCCCRRGSNGG